MSCFDFEPKTWRRSSSSPYPQGKRLCKDDEEEENRALAENKLVDTAIHVFLWTQCQPNLPSHVDNIDILSVQDRGITLAGYNDHTQRRNIIRVSRYTHPRSPITFTRDISGATQCSQRIHLFGQFISSIGKDIPGIVPFVHPPTVVANGFLIEQYEEIVCRSQNNCRLDLHTFVMSNMDGDNARMGFRYLHDVLCGIVELHRHGWAHMDLSLENVVISDDHAYLVDFESVLPFYMGRERAMRRRLIGVPLKAPFVPPEHYMSRDNDMLELPSYDVWAFGIMFFTVLFREYLFALRTVTDPASGRQFVMPVSAQIRYFMAEGFEEFCRKYHPDKYLLMFETNSLRSKPNATVMLDERVSNYLQLCGDLLSKIFARPNAVVLPPENDENEKILGEQTEDGKEKETMKKKKKTRPARVFCTCERYSAQDVYDHPFWDVHAIR